MPNSQQDDVKTMLSPDFAVIDSHHHFWGPGHFGAAKFGDCLPDDIVATIERSGQHLAASVYVDCGWAFRQDGPEHLRCVGETEFVDAVGRHFDTMPSAAGKLCAGIVGKADLMLGDAVLEVLEAHIAAAPDRFRGIRELVGHDREAYQTLNIPAGKTLDSRFRSGFRRLAPLGLSCDLLCVHPMLEEIEALARDFPDTTIILNHFGGPIGIGRFADKRGEALVDWRRKIERLAHFPNIVMKLSGVGADIFGFGWQNADDKPNAATLAKAIAPYVGAAIEAFSPARCMFGTNWPVDSQSFDYKTMWNAFKDVALSYTDEERQDLFTGTATRVYRLDLSEHTTHAY